jgi:hypothetical protein
MIENELQTNHNLGGVFLQLLLVSVDDDDDVPIFLQN